MGIDVERSKDLVDVVFLERVGWGEGQAGPDDGIGVERGDEEREFVLCDVVREVGIGDQTAGEVEEVSTLARWFINRSASVRLCMLVDNMAASSYRK